MGFLNRKKNTDTASSVLSESEIQKKLYGEFSDPVSHAAIGGREHAGDFAPAPLSSPGAAVEKDTDFGLFKAQNEAVSKPGSFPRQVPSEQKPDDHLLRYVPPQDFEKKSVVSSSLSSGVDPYARFRYNRPQVSKWASFLDLLNRFSEKIGEWIRFLADPKQVAVRRVFYWGAAAGVVFLLFWGVNALNSQREEALRIRYKMPGEPVPVKAPDVAAAVVPAKPAVERPVVITPAPARASKHAVPATESYVIQVVTYPSAADADSIVKALKNSGFRAFVKESIRPNGGLFYMVLIGGFPTAADAQSQLSKFRKQEVARPFQDAFIRKNRS